MSYDPKIKNEARDLFLLVDKQGKRQHSLNEIAAIISKKFRKKIHRSTIHTWKESEDWDSDFVKMKKYGIKRAEQADDELLFQKSSDIASFYKIAKGLNIQASNALLEIFERHEKKRAEHPESPIELDMENRDLIALYRHTGNILINLHDDDKESGGLQIIIPEREIRNFI